MVLSPQGMHRHRLNFLIFVLLIIVRASSLSGAAGGASFNSPIPFQPGETLTYRATWGILPAGEVTLEVLPLEIINGVKAYHFVMITKTDEFIDLIYKIRERQDSYVDIDLTHSILYKKRTEGKYPRDVVITFNWETRQATRANFGTKMDPIGILPGSFDPLALLFVIRLHNIREDSVLEIPVTDGDSNIMVQASVVRRETIGVQGNRYDTFEIVPDMERLESQHVVKKSDRPALTVWFTADDKKIPVRIQSKARVGYFIFELVNAS